MPTGLPAAVIDVFLSVQNQVPGKHSGAPGRLTSLIDCQVRKYVGPGQDGERVVVEAREAFKGLPSGSRNAQDGTSASPDWSSPQLLQSLNQQLVSVCSEVPRVYADDRSGWSAYPDVRVLSDKLTQDIYHTSDHTIQVPDGCQVHDSTGMVWTETGYTQAGEPIGSTWFGIKSKLGAWVTTPRQLYAPASSSIRTMAKCVSDGTRFWVFWNDEASGFGINVAVYDEQGLELASTRLTQEWQNTPGYWDVTYQAGKVILAEPGGYNPPNNVGVKLTKLTYASSTITPTSNTDATMLCNGGVAWLTNDADGTKAYLGTLANGTPPGFYKAYAYAVDVATLAQTHEYDVGVNLPYAPDSVTGWTVLNGSNFDVNVAFSLLSQSGQVHGPVYDPALRNVNTYKVLFSGGASLVRVTQSVIMVSRAFYRDGNYYAYTYYQSGSGLTLTQTPISVTVTAGDYMIGNGSQSVTVQPGDYVSGNSFAGNATAGFDVTLGQGSTAITNTDTVELYTVTAGDPLNIGVGAIQPGTKVLKWTFSGLGSLDCGWSNLVVAGSFVSQANGTFFILPVHAPAAANVVYTRLASDQGGTPTPLPSTFTAAGTFTITSNTIYPLSSISTRISDNSAPLFIGGQFTVNLASGGAGNNGTFTCSRLFLDTGADAGSSPYWASPGFGPSVVVTTTTQSFTAGRTYSWVFGPVAPLTWHFQGLVADSSYVGTTLVVDGADGPNNGAFEVTGISGSDFITSGSDAAATLAQVFEPVLPTVSIDIPISQTPYTFRFASVTTDYSFIGASLQIAGAGDAANDGVYTISWLDPADPHKFIATPTNGKTNQVNEAFSTDTPPTVTILKPAGNSAEFQPVWFITPLDGKQPQVGCFERGLAYADWRFEGEQTYPGPNTYPLGLSSPFLDQDNTPSVILPYRAKSFTAGQTVTTPQGTSTSLVVDTLESTVGLKRFRLTPDQGQAFAAFNELIMPGPLGGSFTNTGFHEQGINLAPEAPFLVAQENDAAAFGVTQGQVQVQVTYEWMDENGERGYSAPSPALIFSLQAPNNTYTIGGRLPLPLDSSGNLTANVYGVTNRKLVSICIYRTATVNGIPTTQLYKVTNDLNPNGLYDGVGAGSGFAFPNTYTWYYRDQSLDAAIVNQETLYTSRGLLPRFPAPPLSQGCTWENRAWVVGYDKAVWCSGDKQEGDSNWFFPGFRIPLGSDEPVACQGMEQYLIIGGKERMWYLPAASFPNNTGSSGSFPTPAPLPFQNGTTGYMATLPTGTAYSSTAGGVWLVTRDLKNLWLSEPVKDDLVTVTGMAVDQNQRLAVTNGSATLFVFDPVPACWYKWNLPSAVSKLTTFQGEFAYQDTARVLQQVPGEYLDVTVGGANHPITPDLTLAGISFAQTRAVKQVWEMQLIGEYKGPHKLNAVISYPDDFSESPTSFGPYSPSSTAPYLIAINPAIEEAGQYGLRVFASFEGIDTPGNSFSLELVSCEVGVDRRQGVFKVPTGQRISGG
jgi:hypothetical protein